ncbi:unnamed protein product [Allacma fusca]|uniref:DDE-1 domain-containing protein n=1 Tax=Allacma fusca TaxID=39272 RepID=A0A8J2KYD0_9HEXA|nr:unnamed protein product [Allacma fusca]
MDETALSISSKPLPVLARKGSRHVGRLRAEKSRLITAIYACCASGKYVPPLMVFPGKINEDMFEGAPVGSVGTSSPSGWFNENVFVLCVKHFDEFVKASSNNPMFLILYGHTSHMSYGAIIYCIERDITMITLPSHASHKLQPLDVGVFKSLKSALKVAQLNRLSHNIPKRITEAEIGRIFGHAYNISTQIFHAINAFRATGIEPLQSKYFFGIGFCSGKIFCRKIS